MNWYAVKDGDAMARGIFNRHYSRHHYKDGRRPALFVGPGEKMVLLTTDGRALRVKRHRRRMILLTIILCTVPFWCVLSLALWLKP